MKQNAKEGFMYLIGGGEINLLIIVFKLSFIWSKPFPFHPSSDIPSLIKARVFDGIRREADLLEYRRSLGLKFWNIPSVSEPRFQILLAFCWQSCLWGPSLFEYVS